MKQIVICDDEPLIRQGIQKILAGSYTDAEFLECQNGFDGYKQISLSTPSLVITDIRMPVLSGLEMMEKVRAQGCMVPAILVSAYSDFNYARTGIRFGVCDYILKPINRFELLNCVNRILNIQHTQEPPLADTIVLREESSAIELAVQYLQKNFYRSISLEEVSAAVHMNPNYFSALFKKQTKMKYIDYITELRMMKAKNLLFQTQLQIADIAAMIGYSSTKHFTHLYKERFGCTPSETRKNK